MSSNHPSAFDSDYSQESGPQLQVVVHAGPLAGKGFPITGDTVTFGRDPENNISWDDTQVSRRHARLSYQDDQLVLEDLGSTNGTLVNGRPISGPHVLQPADIISIGSSVFGVKGFSAPNTLGVTQVSRERMTLPPSLSKVASAAPGPASKPVSSPTPQPSSRPVQAEDNGWSMLAIGGVVVFVVVVLALAAVTAYFLIQGREPAITQVPTVVITAPAGGSNVPLNGSVTVQATASDSSGVKRLELWVDGVKITEAESPVEQGQPTFTASLEWVPTSPGNHTLEIRAYNTQGGSNEPVAVVVNAVDDSVAAEPTPTATPGEPTATTPTDPTLTTLTDLNVRAGPDTVYDLLGLLPSGTSAEIIGRDETRQWWQIRFAPAPNGTGWVAADPNFSKTVNVDNVPVAVSPPTPTPTPTNTATTTTTPTASATSTVVPPTATNVPPTETPTSAPTPTPEGPTLDFEVSPTSIKGGECVNVNWTVTGVREVYYQGEGVQGIGDRVECPPETTTFRLRVVRLDGEEQVEDRTVEVTEPVASAGRVTLDPDETIDVDRGQVPGDDFKWDFEGDGVRKFEVRGDVQIALRGVRDSLNDITRQECRDASHGDYDFVDASDSIADPANALRDGFAICYITNEGRRGKMRFPRFTTDALEIEWATWP